MRVLALSGSQLKKGNTSQLIGYLTKRLEKAGISDLSTKFVSLSGLKIKPCKACKNVWRLEDVLYQMTSDRLQKRC